MTENTPTPPKSKFAGRMPLSSNGRECGSVLRPAGHFLMPLSCDDVLSLVRIPVVVLGLCALVGFIFGGMALVVKDGGR